MPPSRATRIPPREWEARKDRLNQLYVERDLPLLGESGVINTMAKEGFPATKSQYESQFRAWGWRKNMSRPEWEGIIHAREQGEAGRPITLGGRVLSDARSKTALRRYRRQISQVDQPVLHDSVDVARGNRISIWGLDTVVENVAPELALPITSCNESTSNCPSAGHSHSARGVLLSEQLDELIHMPPRDDDEPVSFSSDPMDLVTFNMSPFQPSNMDLHELSSFDFGSLSSNSSCTPILNVIRPQHHATTILGRDMMELIHYSSPPAAEAPSQPVLPIPSLRNQWKSPSSTVAAIIMKEIYNAAHTSTGFGTKLDLWGLTSDLSSKMNSADGQRPQTAIILALKSLLTTETYFGEDFTNLPNDIIISVANEARFYGRLVALAINGAPGFQNVSEYGVLTLLGKHTATTLSLMQILNTKPTPLTKSLAENLFTAALEHDNVSTIKFLLDTQLVHANDSVCWFKFERCTPLELASETGSCAAIELLIERQVDVNKSFHEGPTPTYSTALLRLISPRTSRRSIVGDRFLYLVDRFLQAGAVICGDILEKALYKSDRRVAVRLVEHATSQTLQRSIMESRILSIIIERCGRPEAEKMLKLLVEACQKIDDNGVRHGPGIIDILFLHGCRKDGRRITLEEVFGKMEEDDEHSTTCVLGKALTKAIKEGDRYSAAAILDPESEFLTGLVSCRDDNSCFDPAIALKAALGHRFDDIAWGISAIWAPSIKAASLLKITIRERKLDLTRAIIDSHPSPFTIDPTDPLGSTLIRDAIEWGDDSIISSLLPAVLWVGSMKAQHYLEILVDMGRMDLFWGVLEGTDYQRAVRFAIIRENITLLDEVIAHGAELDGDLALQIALDAHSSMVRPLLERYRKVHPQGCPRFGWGLIMRAIDPSPEALKRLDIFFEFGLVKDNARRILDNETLLYGAILSQNTRCLDMGFNASEWTGNSYKSVIERLVDAGSDINVHLGSRSITTPFLGAIIIGIADTVQLLIELGAEVNKQARFGIRFTPLQKAVEQDNLEIVRLLLENGADPNSPPALLNGATALQFAAIRGNCEIAMMLIEHGAKLDVPPPKGPYGRWPLEGAAEAGRIDMIKLLWEMNNGPFDDRQCQMAIRLAERYGHIGCSDLIKELMESSSIY